MFLNRFKGFALIQCDNVDRAMDDQSSAINVHLKGKKLSLVTRTFLVFLLRQGKDVLKHNIPVGQSDIGQVRST